MRWSHAVARWRPFPPTITAHKYFFAALIFFVALVAYSSTVDSCDFFLVRLTFCYLPEACFSQVIL